MKTTVKQIASVTFIALLLLVGNVNAEGTEIKATGVEIIETTLQLESWMTNETIWNNNTTTIMNVAQETETSLELESWMTSEETWNVEDTNVEAELTVEDWMIDSKVWK